MTEPLYKQLNSKILLIINKLKQGQLHRPGHMVMFKFLIAKNQSNKTNPELASSDLIQMLLH